MKMKTNPGSHPLMPAYACPTAAIAVDLSEWPERWMREENDLPVDRPLVEDFIPFLLHLAAFGLKRTIQNNVDNM
jgi:hypothetical protein